MLKKNILVTGNEGYIGSVATDILSQNNFNVIGLDLGVFRDANFIPRAKPKHQIYKDIRDISTQDLRDIDAVLHLAAISNDPLGELDPAITIQINHEATIRLALLAKKKGIRKFIFPSSCSIYGKSNDILVNEQTPLDPQTTYAISKKNAEEDLMNMATTSFTPIIMRNATMFGISPRLRLDLVVQNLSATGYITKKIEILSDGTPWRPLLHVNDFVDAVMFLLKMPLNKISGNPINVGHKSNNYQIKQIASIIKKVIPATSLSINSTNSPDERSYRVDFSQIYRLGWRPKWSVLKGVKQIYEEFNRVRFSSSDFSNPYYHTLQHYQQFLGSNYLDHNLRITAKFPSTASIKT